MPEWPRGRSRHGGVDEVPLPEGPGRLWICGKHFVGPDPGLAMSECGADVIVCLCERHELEDRYPGYVLWLGRHEGAGARWMPVPDLHAPALGRASTMFDELHGMIRAGRGVLMHCGAGVGRAGTIAAGLLIRMGLGHAEALAVVGRSRPMAGPEAGTQSELLESLSGAAYGPHPPGEGRQEAQKEASRSASSLPWRTPAS